MIQPNELRIGNMVLVGDKTVQINDFMAQRGINWIYDEDGTPEYIFKELEPIPLTEEWLVRMGFVKRLEYWEPFVGDAKGAWFVRDDLFITILKVNGKVYRAIATNGDEFGYVDGPELTSVHQLQNLYFALTGEELTIKEPA